MTNVQIVDAALSDDIGTAILELHGDSRFTKLHGDSRLAKLDTSADTHFHRDMQPTGRIEVPVSTLDTQLETLKAPALVKMDIEGSEAAALRGAKQLMTAVRPTLICELHGTHGVVMDLLDSYGYVASAVEQPDTPIREAGWSAHILARPV
jgi:FkbM family methyltransferase